MKRQITTYSAKKALGQQRVTDAKRRVVRPLAQTRQRPERCSFLPEIAEGAGELLLEGTIRQAASAMRIIHTVNNSGSQEVIADAAAEILPNAVSSAADATDIASEATGGILDALSGLFDWF